MQTDHIAYLPDLERPQQAVDTSLPANIPGGNADAASDDDVDLTIVVPCFNEGDNIADTLNTIASAMLELHWSYEVLVIDDGSSDQTAAMVEKYLKDRPDLPFRFYRNARNRGLTRTYVDGAFLGRGKYYRLVCGDNVEPAETLVRVFSALGEADMIVPFHEAAVGKPPFRRCLSRTYTALVNLLSGYHIRYYNGLAAHLRYNVMRWGPYSFGFGFQAELITRLLDEGATYVEIPVVANHKEKSGSNSAINVGNWLSVGHTLLEVMIRCVRRRVLHK
jgi:glycosyltransferase involved in cell wall biosynthesis